MRRYRKWVMTLGLVVATPGLAPAAPFFGSNDAPSSSAAAPAKSKNQKVAEDIATALKKANFRGYEIDIEYKDGLATLRGKVSDPRQKARANQIVQEVPGVRRVDNKLVVLAAATRSAIRQVAGESEAVPAVPPAPAGPGAANQEKAMQIGRALQGAGLNGYDVEIIFHNGQAVLRGSVGTQEQKAIAAQVAGSVPGVQAVANQLRVDSPMGPTPAQQRYMMTAYQPVPGVPAGPGAAPPPGAPQMGAPMPATGPVPNGPIYDNPNIPEYAWPAYAQYPNYAAVTYPSQYSASAWPYIGPFYPYPQVPLNWRKVTLEWDDGHWDLKFDSRTDKWFWFMNPKNWRCD